MENIYSFETENHATDNIEELFKNLKKLTSLPAEEAHCLPFECYSNRTILDTEVKEIFHSDWIFIGTESELPNCGDYLALDIGGEPVVIIRGKDQELRAFSNVCRHRGATLNPIGFGNVKKFICPYHAWTYNDKGELLGVPFKGKVKLDKKEHCLPEFQLHIWQGCIFINLDQEAEPFGDRLSMLDPYCELFQMKKFTKSFARTQYRCWEANWKVIMENAIESYHQFKVHNTTLEKYTPTKDVFYLKGSADCSLLAGKIIEINKMIKLILPDFFDYYLIMCLRPNCLMILRDAGIEWLSAFPIGRNKTAIRAGGASLTGKQNIIEKRFKKSFFDEDEVIVKNTQAGMHSRLSKGGKLVEMERPLVDFHQYWGRRLFGATPTPLYTNEKKLTEFHKCASEYFGKSFP
ncbi:aromatic ring-hydroxylating dioxygenase subunit alpha [Candidatus Uabimicrobium sp. HlEnr_7]|uniref:aromatic ring-hydroxylating oxygenase subunit alpha n=1 Tax=Candidatus Uabimicrobium helgolandensis TaxID=3095367 RepID=UPI003558C5DB